MADVPTQAKCVVIGAGIVGNSLVHHLAELGWTDIVQIDKGPLPNPGGSTGHASNFIFLTDHSREITDLTLDSVAQYREMGVLIEPGGFEVARTEERMEELRRRMSSAKAWGIEGELVTPEFVQEKVPFLDKDQIIGAFWQPKVGVVDSLRAGTIMRERALEKGVLTVVPNVEVTDLTSPTAGSPRVVTTGGTIEAETVVIACGVWSPKIADMAGVSLPLVPAVHQMISVGPCPQLAETEGEITFPIVRDMDTFCYERQHGADMEVGSYAHRAILMEPEDIPSIEQSKLSPTELPFTSDDFDPQLEQAYELMPELLGAEGAEMRYAINGLLSLTCDGLPILGESDVAGLWTAAAVWIKEGPGVGRAVAEWMTQGWSEIDVSHSDIARFHEHQKRREHTRLRTTESFIKTYGIVHPAEQYESDRNQRLSPMHDSQQKLGAFFFETAGWERPHWYESNADLLEQYGDAVMPREHEWDSRWWSPIINAEHLRMREAAGVIDLTAFQIFDIEGAGALDSVQRTCVAQCDVAVGKVIYTPVLDGNGGFRSDLTVMRLGDDHFRVVTGGAHGPADRKWFSRPPGRRRRPHREDRRRLDDRPVGPERPRHPRLAHRRGRLGRGLPDAVVPRDHRERCHRPRLADLLRRRARLGALRRLRRRRRAVGGAARHQVVRTAPSRSGIGVYGTTGRIEKGYRAYGYELDGERTIVEAAMQRPKVKAADFTGKERYLAQRESAPQTVLCTLTVEDHTSASGVKRYMLGGEPILTRDGGTLTDGHGHHPYVTTAGSAPSLGKHVLMAYLPVDAAVIGNELAVSYMEELYPVVVGSVDATPLFDPSNDRMR